MILSYALLGFLLDGILFRKGSKPCAVACVITGSALFLATGESAFTCEEVTQHLLTNAHVVRQFVDAHIEIDGEMGQPGTVRIAPSEAVERR